MTDYVKRSDVINYVCQFCKDQHADELCDQWDVCQLFTRINNVPAADVVERDEGIKIGAALAAMHGSDATSQDLAEAYFEGMEEGYKKGRNGFEKCGMWLWNSHNGFSYCSCCDAISPHEDQYGEYCDRPKYCPNCGAKMENIDDV